ncbi:MAG: isoleucine--tRNA ligase [Candidatus Nanoarchaeia archaeon]|nr:isoleucine--tRNA ligase [Candidatus Nanoarchaeia archaeon]
MYDHKKVEESILKYWQDNHIYENLKKKLKGNKKFYFLDGPPYTSGRLHIGHAWNYSLKDQILRYKRMNNLDVWDRAGYDMHGLPTENKVQKQLNFKDKKEIEDYGVDKFVKKCREFAVKNMQQMSLDQKRFGAWLDFDNAYQPIKNEYMESEWWLIKQAHEKKRLYKGNKVMTWCPSCETGLAKHELEYYDVEDDSIFVKFQIENKKNEFLVVWTTTPWTIPFNLGVMVNPELDYVKVRVGSELWVLAKGLANIVILNFTDEKKLNIVEEFKGDKLKGMHYVHPFYDTLKKHYDELKKQSKDIFSVVLSEKYVDLSAGTGLVHMAPGCGPEDFEVGKENKIPAFNNLTEKGDYPKDMGEFSGLNAKKDNQKFIDALEKRNALVATTKVSHEYPHCWRCKHPVVFKLTGQWFLKIEDLVPKMLEDAEKIKFVPEESKERYKNWIKNLKDNAITRQRYWGTPAPIWTCDKCESTYVIESIKELKTLAGKIPEDLHKPWIDEITFKCKKCNGLMKRVPDILDVWIDSGVASWACLDYPNTEKNFKELWPADLVLEGTEQTRLWFYMLHLLSRLVFNKPCYKNVYTHGMLRDVEGEKMSKSIGNIISPYDIVDQYGIDTLRCYTISNKAGEDMNYTKEEILLKFRNLAILINITNYLLGYAPSDLINKKTKKLEIEDKYIISKTNSIIKKVTEAMENYELDKAPLLVEELYLDLSRTYIKLTRDRSESVEVLKTIYDSLMNILKMFSITAPFITEHLYLKLKEKFNLKGESIHHYSWPKYDKKLINEELENSFVYMSEVIQEILAQREKYQIGVRWPLSLVIIKTNQKEILDSMDITKDLVLTQTNIKEMRIEKKDTESKFEIVLDTSFTPELEQEGFRRELTRRIQDLRKKNKLVKEDRIELFIETSYKLGDLTELQETVGAVSVSFKGAGKVSSKENIKGKEFKISFNINSPKIQF